MRLHKIHMHAKYEVSTCTNSKVMANVNMLNIDLLLRPWPWTRWPESRTQHTFPWCFKILWSLIKIHAIVKRKWLRHETPQFELWPLSVTLTLDLGNRELDATHLLMVLYNSVKFDSNPFNNTEVMAETRNVTDERTDRQTNGRTNERTDSAITICLFFQKGA